MFNPPIGLAGRAPWVDHHNPVGSHPGRQLRALLPVRVPRLVRVERERLIAVVQRLSDGHYSSDEEADHLVAEFEAGVLDPHVADLNLLVEQAL